MAPADATAADDDAELRTAALQLTAASQARARTNNVAAKAASAGRDAAAISDARLGESIHPVVAEGLVSMLSAHPAYAAVVLSRLAETVPSRTPEASSAANPSYGPLQGVGSGVGLGSGACSHASVHTGFSFAESARLPSTYNGSARLSAPYTMPAWDDYGMYASSYGLHVAATTAMWGSHNVWTRPWTGAATSQATAMVSAAPSPWPSSVVGPRR